MEVNRISKQTLGSYRFACLFPLLACPMLTMILHKLTLSNLTEVVFVRLSHLPFFSFDHRKIQVLLFSCMYNCTAWRKRSTTQNNISLVAWLKWSDVSVDQSVFRFIIEDQITLILFPFILDIKAGLNQSINYIPTYYHLFVPKIC